MLFILVAVVVGYAVNGFKTSECAVRPIRITVV